MKLSTFYKMTRWLLVGGIFLFFVFLLWIACALFTIGWICHQIMFFLDRRPGDPVLDAPEGSSADFAHFLVFAAGAIAIPILIISLYKSLRKNPRKARSKRHQREKHMSTLERTMRARRNALVGNYFGLGGGLVGMLLILLHWRIFSDRSYEIILGMFIFCAGYCGIICGSWWWLKAKAWTEGVIVIGVAPLVVLFIPFVRLIFIKSPLLLFLTMGASAAILFVVVAALPDKSGVNKQRKPWTYKDVKQKQDS